jgi:hypothetical protein
VLAEAAPETRIRAVERSLEGLGQASPGVERLRTIPGVGLLTATTLVAFVGDMARFPSGRHLASYLGLTPREASSGLRRRLGAIAGLHGLGTGGSAMNPPPTRLLRANDGDGAPVLTGAGTRR